MVGYHLLNQNFIIFIHIGTQGFSMKFRNEEFLYSYEFAILRISCNI